MKNLRKLIAATALFLSASLAPLSASAQEYITVVYDSIQSVVQNRPEVFRALTARFMDADTTLTLQDMAIVYYGHAFTPQYNPDEKYADVYEAMESGDMNLVITLADEALRHNPVSLAMLFKLYGACSTSEIQRLRDRAPGLLNRIFMICDLIAASGLGVLPQGPWCVISESDINEFLTKYAHVQRELERTDVGSEKAVKVRMDGIDEDVILYFDLLLAKNKKK